MKHLLPKFLHSPDTAVFKRKSRRKETASEIPQVAPLRAVWKNKAMLVRCRGSPPALTVEL
jgi:hypothetical protein